MASDEGNKHPRFRCSYKCATRASHLESSALPAVQFRHNCSNIRLKSKQHGLIYLANAWTIYVWSMLAGGSIAFRYSHLSFRRGTLAKQSRRKMALFPKALSCSG